MPSRDDDKGKGDGNCWGNSDSKRDGKGEGEVEGGAKGKVKGEGDGIQTCQQNNGSYNNKMLIKLYSFNLLLLVFKSRPSWFRKV